MAGDLGARVGEPWRLEGPDEDDDGMAAPMGGALVKDEAIYVRRKESSGKIDQSR